MISSVFHNRFKKKMRLQSDPTTIYGMWERYRGNITETTFSRDTLIIPIMYPALPAGPDLQSWRKRSTPRSIRRSSEFLYFVSHNDGTHEFTRTYQDHLGAVRKFQLDPTCTRRKELARPREETRKLNGG